LACQSVVTSVALQQVVIATTDDGVVAVATDQDIAVGGAVDGIVSALAQNRVVTRATVQRVVACVGESCGVSFDQVRAVTTGDRVIAVAAKERVEAVAAVDPVVAAASENVVIPVPAVQRVVTKAAVDQIVSVLPVPAVMVSLPSSPRRVSFRLAVPMMVSSPSPPSTVMPLRAEKNAEFTPDRLTTLSPEPASISSRVIWLASTDCTDEMGTPLPSTWTNDEFAGFVRTVMLSFSEAKMSSSLPKKSALTVNSVRSSSFSGAPHTEAATVDARRLKSETRRPER
jgi:hypothetical protein